MADSIDILASEIPDADIQGGKNFGWRTGPSFQHRGRAREDCTGEPSGPLEYRGCKATGRISANEERPGTESVGAAPAM
jgi:hypothetical protein